jgi:hypothetical protein
MDPNAHRVVERGDRRAAYAERVTVGEWAHAKPAAIPELMNEMLPAWIANGVSVSIFWLPTGKGILVDPTMLRDALLEASATYGDEYKGEGEA